MGINTLAEEVMESAIAKFDLETQSALRRLLECEVFPEIKIYGENAEVIVEQTPSFIRKIILKNVDAIPKGKTEHYCSNLGIVFKEEEKRFCFYGELEDPINETACIFALTFENAETQIQLYNSCKTITFWENPWDFLRTISFSIGMKADLPGDYCNSKEKELLPLIKEIVSLEYWMELPQQELLSFKELKKATHRFGYNKAEKLFAELETINTSDSKFRKTSNKLISLLCKKACEPLWREIYNKIADSQSSYPGIVDCLCPKDLLAETRKNIQLFMESKGYTGQYPDFIKKGAMKGIHLARSYDKTYFVGMEKKAEYYIHCSEAFYEDEGLTIQFICGTAILKKGDAEKDIYGCLFNANGRRFFNTMRYVSSNNEEADASDDFETHISIAVKRAECRKLSKAERSVFFRDSLNDFKSFLWIFLIGGGFFGVAMTLIMMLVCIIATAAFGLFYDIPEMMRTMPWGLILAMGWIGFGGSMGIVEILADRK